MMVSADLYGYCDRFEYRPGEDVAVHVHAKHPAVVADVVRLRNADERVHVPFEEAVPSVAELAIAGQTQRAYPGSFGIVEGLDVLAGADDIELRLWMYPTILGHDVNQGLAGLGTGVTLELAPDDHLEVRVGGSIAVRADRAIEPRTWCRITARVSTRDRFAAIEHEPAKALAGGRGASSVRSPLEGDPAPALAPGHLVVGAASVDLADARPVARNCFNGKLEDVALSVAGTELLRLDFSQKLASDQVLDVSGNGHHGRLVNNPMRAVTGHAWRGDEIDHRRAPAQWNAIHFHEDDLEEAGWPVAATISLPGDLASGIYAVRLRAKGCEDRVPFFVLPPATRPRPEIVFLAPTFTYQAYGNARLSERIDYEGSGLSGRPYTPGERDRQAASNPEVSGSLYDVHRDGSGCCFVSSLRPIFNFRADYRSAVQQAPRHLGGDLYLTGWLDHLERDYDVVTDHALHDEGAGLLDGYKVLVTGSHPEYSSGAMLGAFETFLERGGRIMYLGANGFYWVTSRDPNRPHILECRRGHAGTRTWESSPGETHHSSTGEPGGLWRFRGRTPHILFGIGMASQGWDMKAPGFARTPESFGPDVSWIFDGIPDDATIGDAGLVMDGASGDELDRYDAELGSPVDAIVLATSLPHSHYYKPVIEDVPMIVDGLGGDENEKVRSDVVYRSCANGGAVFSVGSISWAGAMAYNDFDNDVAKICGNVLERFVSDPPAGPR